MASLSKSHPIETLLYAGAGALLVVSSQLVLKETLPVVGGSFFARERGAVVSVLLMGYGILLLGWALLSFFYARRGISLGAWLGAQLRAVFRLVGEIVSFIATRCQDRLEMLLLALVTLLGIGIRLYFLNQPMRMDESYTFLYYLNPGRDPFAYIIPNNHVLHTLLAWLSVSALGMGPLAIRLPAFLAGVICIPLMYFVGKAFDQRVGLAAAVGMAVFPYMILYSTMARGYSLLVLLMLLLLLAGRYYLEKPSLAGCILIALISALGLLTMPTMVFPLAGFYVWAVVSFVSKKQPLGLIFRDFVLPTALITAFLTVLLYTPTVIASNGPQAIFSNKFVDSRSWRDFFNHLLPHVQQIGADFSRDLPWYVLYPALALALLGWLDAARRRDWLAFLLLPSMLVGGLAVLFAKHVIPFVRTWIYWVPLPLLFADLGFSYLAGKLQPRYRLALAGLVCAAGLFLAVSVASRNAILRYDDAGSFPEAAAVAQYLKPLLTGNEYIVVRDTANYPVFYYLCYDGAPPQNAGIDPATAKRYFITQQGWHELGDLTDQPATPVFETGAATVYVSSGGQTPVLPMYVFDCRNTRK